ncbi:MAG: GAF domain-containing protein, partial [Anaerolineales bacterium]
LWTAQQELQIQKQLKEARALTNIERVLGETEQVGIETVLQLIVDAAKELIPGAEQAVLHLLDNEQQILVPRAVSGVEYESATSLNMRLGEGIAGQVILTREVIRISDAQNDPRFFESATPVSFRSLIVAPIKTNERCAGTISVQSERPNAFTPEESHLLGALGTQAAIAIENANLLETTRQDLKEINALYLLSQGLAASLDPDQLMKDVVKLLQLYFGYYHVQIYVTDPQSGDLIARCGAGNIGDQLSEQGFRLPVGAGIVGHVAETGQPFVTNDADNIIFFNRNPLLPDTQSELSIPIKVENQVLGVLDIQQTPPGRLNPRDIQLLTAVADQLAVALQKANLYTDLQVSLGQEKAMRSQLIQSERLAVVGRLLASVSHELGNPLQALQNALFLLKEDKGISDQGRQDLQIVFEETERMGAMIDRLRFAYRPIRAEDFQQVKLNGIVEDVRALMATHMRHKEISFEFHPDPELRAVPGIPDQIRQVLLNLFINAVEAMKMGGCLTVQTQQLPEQDKILLSVTDTGPGIDPAILSHIFEPFITDKETGTGLGLTITNDIIRHHHGDIQAENNPGGGATFKVWLPAARKKS